MTYHDPFQDLRPEDPPEDRFPPFQEEAAIPPFPFVAVGDLQYRPPVFLVDGLIEADTLGLLFGDPGCGKSFAAVDLSLCVATGADFHGRRVKQGTVIYIAGEGHNGLARRFTAWSVHHGASLKGVPMFKSERAAQFLDMASARSVTQAVRGLADRVGPPALIVVDTLARNFGAGDENNTQDMNNFVVAMDDLRANWPGCVLLIVHHSGHASKERARGAMSLKGALDFEYRLQKEDTALTLSNTKMKDAEPPEDMFFGLEGIDLEKGGSSAVLVSSERPRIAKQKKPLTGKAEVAMQALLDALRDHGETRRGDGYPCNRQVVNVAHWRAACDLHGLTDSGNDAANRQAFKRAKDRLLDADEVRLYGDFVWRVRDDDAVTDVTGRDGP